MAESTDCDVLVCGLGPVGQLLANLLGALGVRTVAVDSAAGPSRSPRAAAIDDEVLRILQGVGLDATVLAGAQVQRRVSFVTAAGAPLEVLRAADGRLGHPPLVSIHQPTMERSLLDGLDRFAGVEVRWDQRLVALDRAEDRVTAWIRPAGAPAPSPLAARWVVGCDGSRSFVRGHLGVAFGGSSFAQRWLVVDVRCDRPVRRAPHPQFVGDPARPVVTLPMGPGRHRWEWLLRPEEDDARITDPDRVEALLRPWRSGERLEVERAVVYTFQDRRAARWRVGRVLLAGDAAHVMPPFAGQGFASGARDAANLAWKLAATIHGAPPALLDSYEAERAPHVAAMSALAVRWGGVVQTRSPWVAQVRDRLLTGAARTSLADRVKPLPTYRAGAFVERPARLPWRRTVGALFPQPSVSTPASVAPVLLDDALGPGWAALTRGSAAAAPLRTAGLRVLELGSGLDDRTGTLAGWLDRAGGDFVVLRPDRHVFACGPAARAGDAAAALRHLLGT